MRLEQVLSRACLLSDHLDTDLSGVELHGDMDPIYASPLPLAAGTAGVLALIGAEASAIRRAQTGIRQTASVDRLHALLTISSMWVLKVDDALAISKFMDAIAAGQGVFRCRDGKWLYLLSGFPHIVDKTLDAFGVAVEGLEQYIAANDSDALEDKLVQAQLPGVVIRDHATWLDHPQGRMLQDHPVVTVEKIGDAPVKPLSDEDLHGLRVLDATRVLAGPTCGKMLAALGADVLHVGSAAVPDMVAAQIDTGAGKRRAFVDLEMPEGSQTMWDLLATADVFSQSYRANSLARRGLSVQAVAQRNPGVIYVTENAYGDFGPWREKRGFDGNVQAASGIHALHHPPGAPLAINGIAMAMNDYCTGYWAAYGVLNALRRRAQEGGSWHVKVSLAQTARWFMRLGATCDVQASRSEDALWSAVARYSESDDSPYGLLQRLKFPIEFSHSRARFGATVVPGHDHANW